MLAVSYCHLVESGAVLLYGLCSAVSSASLQLHKIAVAISHVFMS